jgi:hypothetical protein
MQKPTLRGAAAAIAFILQNSLQKTSHELKPILKLMK